MKVKQVGGGATVKVYTTNGIESFFSVAGSTSVKTVSGLRVYGSVQYSDCGQYYNYPKGTWVY